MNIESDDDLEDDFVWVEPSSCGPRVNVNVMPVLGQESNEAHPSFFIDNWKADQTVRPQTMSVERLDSSRYYTTSKQQQITQQFIDHTLRDLLYLFRSNTYQKYEMDIRRQPYPPLVLLFDRTGRSSTVPRDIIQEFKDLFRAMKFMINKVEEAKITQYPRITWDVGWNFLEWSKQVNLLKKEVQDFFSTLDKKCFDDDFTVIEYNPEYTVLTRNPMRSLRPSKREIQREKQLQMYRPISIHAIDINWLYDLFMIFNRYMNLTPPVSIFELFSSISREFSSLSPRDRQILITICEDVLGGLSIQSITRNLEKWLHNNRDVVLKGILQLLNYNPRDGYVSYTQTHNVRKK